MIIHIYIYISVTLVKWWDNDGIMMRTTIYQLLQDFFHRSYDIIIHKCLSNSCTHTLIQHRD